MLNILNILTSLDKAQHLQIPVRRLKRREQNFSIEKSRRPVKYIQYTNWISTFDCTKISKHYIKKNNIYNDIKNYPKVFFTVNEKKITIPQDYHTLSFHHTKPRKRTQKLL